MKTLRKYFNPDGKETTPDKAVRCHELTVDDKGKVVSDASYKVASKKDKAP